MGDRTDDVTIPLVEERLVTSKRIVETGHVKVRTMVEEREAVVREQLSRAYVDVERVPVNRNVDEIPQVREEGDTTIIPVVQEVLVVRKQLVLTEEIRVRKRQVMEEHVEPVSLRSHRAVVERDDGSVAPAPGTPEQ